MTGLPESAQPKITLQLSSPIEAKTITKLFDPLDNDDAGESVDEEKENEKVEEVKSEGEEKEETLSEEGVEVKLEEEEGKTNETKDCEQNDTNNDDKPKDQNGDDDDDDDAQDKPETAVQTKSALEKLSSHVTFRGVDTSVATLTIEVSDADIPLGTSATMYDVGPLCEVDVLRGITKKVTDLEVAIVADDDVKKDGPDVITQSESELFQDAVEEENEESENKDEEKGEEIAATLTTEAVENKTEEKTEEEKDEGATKESDNDAGEDTEVEGTKAEEVKDEKSTEVTETKEETEASTKVIIPTCTVSLKIEYNASIKDQTLLLNEKYNAAVARQTVAVEKLRKIAMAVRRAQLASGGTDRALTSASGNKKPAVKPGFLKKAAKKEPMFLVRWYEKTLGPNSLLRKIYPIAKNYVLFFGGVALMHFQGHQLALPPPV